MHKKILAIAVLLAFLVPVHVGADQTTCSLEALDTVAGLGSEVSAMQCDKNATMSLALTNPAGQKSGLILKTDSVGNGRVTISSSELSRAGTYTVTSGARTVTFEVLSDGPDASKSFLIASKTSIRSDGSNSAVVTATLRDQFGNPLSGRPVALLSNRTQDIVSANANETDAQGEMSWIVTSRQPGIMTLTAYDILSTSAISERVEIRVGGESVDSFGSFTAALTGTERGGDFGALDHFDIRIIGKETVLVNEDVTLEITALDSNNLVVEDFVGTVTFSSTDSQAILPGNGQINFQPAELGVKRIALGLRFRTSGNQTLVVRDLQSAAQGQLSVNVTRGPGSGEGGDIEIISPEKDATVSKPQVLVQGRAPSLVNLKVVGGKTDAYGESDAEGVFRINVELNENQTDHTLFIVSDNGRYQSEPHHIVLDKSKPTVEGVSFDPAVGRAGEETRITVRGEEGLKSMTAQIGPATAAMTEKTAGLYDGTFIAPSAGEYDVKIKAIDPSGNETEVLTKWTVDAKGTDKVLNVKAESRPNAVMLTWDGVESAAQYKVYVGEQPNDFGFTLETGSPNTSALVQGLVPGKQYYFAITAVNADGGESDQKSDVITGTALGMSVTAKPGSQSILLEWSVPEQTPLAGYTLEYGVDPNNYTETRLINGSLRAYTVRDLIDGVTYEFKLTPVTVDGQKITELSTIVWGTPSGTGFGGGSPDPVPGIVGGGSSSSLHGGAPLNPPYQPGSGLPNVIVWSLGAVLLFGTGFAFYRHRQQKVAHSFMREMDRRYTE